MPDFIHQSTETKPVQPQAEGAVSNQVAPQKPMSHAPRPGSGKPQLSQDEKKPAEPSKLFTEYYAVVFLFFITAFIAGGYFFLNPLYTEFKAINSSIGGKFQTLEQERAYLTSLNKSIAAAQSIPAETLAKVDEALPEGYDIPRLLIALSAIAKKNDVALTGVQFSPTKGTTPVGKSKIILDLMDINLAIDGAGYQKMRAFLHDMETSVRLFEMDSITVSGDPSTGKLSYSFTLKTFSMQKSEKKAAASAAAAAAAGEAPVEYVEYMGE